MNRIIRIGLALLTTSLITPLPNLHSQPIPTTNSPTATPHPAEESSTTETVESDPSDNEAEEEIEVVVSATRYGVDIKKTGRSIQVLSAEQLERTQRRTVNEALQTAIGINISRNGAVGSSSNTTIRGLRARHVLVLIDGVEASDPTTPAAEPDLRNLLVENIERVEILRGPQSVLYGSDAVSGVINIVTKKGQGDNQFTYRGEGGSFATHAHSASVSGSNEKTDYSFNVSTFNTEGISAVTQRDNNELDGYENITFSQRVGHQWIDEFKSSIVLRYINAENEYDSSPGTFAGAGFDRDNYTRMNELYLRNAHELSLFDGFWEQEFGVSYTFRDRTFVQPVNSPFRNNLEGEILKLDWRHVLNFCEETNLTLGVENEEQFAFQEQGAGITNPLNGTTQTTSIYLQEEIRLWERWFTTIGGRLITDNDWGDKLLYQVATSYLVEETGTRFKGSIGSSFSAPSIFHLTAQPFNNPDLVPEEAVGIDLGVEQYLLEDRLTIGTVFFQNEIQNLIDFDTKTSRYRQLNAARTEGVESYLTAQITDWLTLNGSYTYLETMDLSTAARLPLTRQAQHKVAWSLDFDPIEELNIALSGYHVNRSRDGTVFLDPWTIWNIAINYQVNDHLELFTRVDNLFDERYQEIANYGYYGLAAFGGIKLTY